MAAAAAADFNFQSAEGKIHIVVYDDYIFCSDREEVCNCPYRLATAVHKILWLGDYDLLAEPQAMSDHGIKLCFIQSNAGFTRDTVCRHKSNIVPGPAVCGAWIAKTCYKLHRVYVRIVVEVVITSQPAHIIFLKALLLQLQEQPLRQPLEQLFQPQEQPFQLQVQQPPWHRPVRRLLRQLFPP
jgi:hypothetical protein